MLGWNKMSNHQNLLFIGASFKGAKAQCRKMGIYKRKA